MIKKYLVLGFVFSFLLPSFSARSEDQAVAPDLIAALVGVPGSKEIDLYGCVPDEKAVKDGARGCPFVIQLVGINHAGQEVTFEMTLNKKGDDLAHKYWLQVAPFKKPFPGQSDKQEVRQTLGCDQQPPEGYAPNLVVLRPYTLNGKFILFPMSLLSDDNCYARSYTRPILDKDYQAAQDLRTFLMAALETARDKYNFPEEPPQP